MEFVYFCFQILSYDYSRLRGVSNQANLLLSVSYLVRLRILASPTSVLPFLEVSARLSLP